MLTTFKWKNKWKVWWKFSEMFRSSSATFLATSLNLRFLTCTVWLTIPTSLRCLAEYVRECLCKACYNVWHPIRAIAAVVQLLSRVWLIVAPGTAVCQASLSSTVSWGLLEFMSIGLVMLSNHLILCHWLSFNSLGPVNPPRT